MYACQIWSSYISLKVQKLWQRLKLTKTNRALQEAQVGINCVQEHSDYLPRSFYAPCQVSMKSILRLKRIEIVSANQKPWWPFLLAEFNKKTHKLARRCWLLGCQVFSKSVQRFPNRSQQETAEESIARLQSKFQKLNAKVNQNVHVRQTENNNP